MPDDLTAIRRQLAQLEATMDRIAHDQQVQFTRIAHLQADFDLIRGAWNELKGPRGVPYNGPDRRNVPRKTR
jgi:hypothetical protein